MTSNGTRQEMGCFYRTCSHYWSVTVKYAFTFLNYSLIILLQFVKDERSITKPMIVLRFD